MADAYTTLWTNDLCRALISGGYEGQRPSVLFGGPHQSQPSFVRAGVRPGDRVYPIRVFRKRMWVLGAMEVGQLLDYDTAGEHLDMEDYLRLVHWKPLKGGCVSEVVVGPPGTPLAFDRAVPGDLLARLTCRSRRGERQIKHVVDGELRSVVSLRGIYRLAPESAGELEALVAAAE
ncbi:hypothetical protein [Streptomyces poonensis]|uniref:Uncharacterized protein n=1 Tax=Streptomyces poonensis TaxID=68255 RepID=A0A918USJ3_9ACTN|nr:hypothetical protein [Streptomyces poonensis]GGZ32112.1 hypothetical protein GCM10010365_61040 [Streptomyces poonensis]GLJ93410.1 hypothetical protein GCM10017589_60220 [Streptomyces poonensis]